MKLKKVVASLFTRDAATFLFFLLLAFTFWLMHGTSATRDVKIKVPLVYVGIPANVELQDSLPTAINIVVKDRGSVLLPYYFKSVPPVTIDLSRSFNESGYLDYSLSSVIPQIMSHFPTSTVLYDSDISQIVSPYRILRQKEVPVSYVTHYAPLLPYVLKDSITFTPDRVTLFGVKSVLDTINQVYVSGLSDNVTKSNEYSLSVVPIPGVKIEPKNILVNVDVEMSTEKVLELPIEYVGCPEEIQMRTFPDKVKVFFNVGVSRFQEIETEDFKVILPYDSIKQKEDKQAGLILTKQPEGIFQVRIDPSDVEYILEEK